MSSGGCSETLGTVIKTMSLITRIGNVPGDATNVFGTWPPEGVWVDTITTPLVAGEHIFPEGWPSVYWGFVRFRDHNLKVESDGRNLYTTPTAEQLTDGGAGSDDYYRSVLWVTTLWADDPDLPDRWFIDMTGASLVFRYVPSMSHHVTGRGNWDNQWNLFDFGESGPPWPDPFPFSFCALEFLGGDLAVDDHGTIFISIDDSNGPSDNVEITYDPEQHHWFKLEHEASTNTFSWWTAPRDFCDASPVWTKQLEVGPMVSRVTSYSLEWINDLFYKPGDPAPTIAQWGALNDTPEHRVLPLFTRIGEPELVMGDVVKELPLFTEIGEPSGASP